MLAFLCVEEVVVHAARGRGIPAEHCDHTGWVVSVQECLRFFVLRKWWCMLLVEGTNLQSVMATQGGWSVYRNACVFVC